MSWRRQSWAISSYRCVKWRPAKSTLYSKASDTSANDDEQTSSEWCIYQHAKGGIRCSISTTLSCVSTSPPSARALKWPWRRMAKSGKKPPSCSSRYSHARGRAIGRDGATHADEIWQKKQRKRRVGRIYDAARPATFSKRIFPSCKCASYSRRQKIKHDEKHQK